MNFSLDLALEILHRTPATLRAMLDGVSDCWTHNNYGEDTFSAFDIVGHLIAGEKTDWMTRTRIVLEHGPAKPFAKYDRYAQFEECRGKTMRKLLDEFEHLRMENLAALRDLNLSEADFARRGTHPALGEVTLGNLLATWVAHDLNHIAQIAKAMATQYEDAVGPWCEYLGILKSPITRMDADGAARRKKAMSTTTA